MPGTGGAIWFVRCDQASSLCSPPNWLGSYSPVSPQIPLIILLCPQFFPLIAPLEFPSLSCLLSLYFPLHPLVFLSNFSTLFPPLHSSCYSNVPYLCPTYSPFFPYFSFISSYLFHIFPLSLTSFPSISLYFPLYSLSIASISLLPLYFACNSPQYPPRQLAWNPLHGRVEVEQKWSVGPTPFGPFSHSLRLGFPQRDASRRNMVLSALNESLSDALETLHIVKVINSPFYPHP